LSEDAFRDQVVRPLFLRRGLRDGRDLCGPFEKGKDAVFLSLDQLGMHDVYVVQTKKGNLNLTKKTSQSIVEAITQIRTSLATKVTFITTKEKKYPTKVMLCASGKINDAAQQHIVEEVDDPRIVFMDADDLIPVVDQHFPELWFGIDAELLPYLRALRRSLETSSENVPITDVLPGGDFLAAATDKMFVELRLWRPVFKPRRERGQVLRVPAVEEMPVTGILRRRIRLVLILGEAGSGKSTSLRRLAYVLTEEGFASEEHYTIPILVRAVDVERRRGSLLVEICGEETKRLTGSGKPSFSTIELMNGRVVVLIDALDEVPDDAGRAAVLKSVVDFHKSYPECQVIITSREYAYVKDLKGLEGYTTYRLSPISYRQAEQMVDRLQKGRSLPAEASKEIIRRLQDVHGIELNPLLVTVFAATSDYSRRDIPANITELFKKYTEMMLGRWDATKGFAQQYHAPLKDFILTKVAFDMHRHHTTSIGLEDFKSTVERELEKRGHTADVEQLLDEMLDRSGLFRIVASRLEFRHLLLQEFFAGRGIPSGELLEKLVEDEWWRRGIVFYFGQNPGDASGLQSIMGSLVSKSAGDAYKAAVTLGLALQACYLVTVEEKVRILREVIEGLAKGREEFLTVGEGERPLPLTRFLAYYMFGRDSVAASVLDRSVDEIIRAWKGRTLANEETDIRTFWLIVGLIESGALAEAEALVKQFRPSDPRFLLAIYLGCNMVQHLRITTEEQKEAAARMNANLVARVEHMRVQLLKEWQTELLEIRQDKIKAIESKNGPKS